MRCFALILSLLALNACDVIHDTLPFPGDAGGLPGDRDDDGIPDGDDNCPGAANHGQSDFDADGVGDACDVCPEHVDPRQADTDGDGTGDACDPGDADGDGLSDVEDDCPFNADPGQDDDDDDGVGTACDNCPDTPNHAQQDADGDGIGDACEVVGDDDGDGVPDAADNCAGAANGDQADADDDGVGDACDNCPGTPNFGQADADGDGRGDACDAPDDADGDGVPDAADNCPATPNPDQADADGDGTGDACEGVLPPDRDGDGLPDARDNCPSHPNPDQADADGDGTGDACEGPDGPDDDGDEVPDARDNCPAQPNHNQLDSDGDGAGDACDPPGPRTRVEITARWAGENANVDLHLLDPRGSWLTVFDLHPGNPAPRWAVPGITQLGDAAPGPEGLVVEALPPGVYVIGATYQPTVEGVAAPGAQVEIAVRCGDRQRDLGPGTLDQPFLNGFEGFDIWQAATLRLPECEVTPLPVGSQYAVGVCPLGVCVSCQGCQRGLCAGARCPESTCDLRTGACIDPCEGVDCGVGGACEPYDLACYPTGRGQCDACESAVQCTADGTTACLVNVDNGESFCAAPCRGARDCDAGYACAELGGGGGAFCLPDAGTCVDRCGDVRCPDGEVCDPLTGLCADAPCARNHDCDGAQYCDAGVCTPTGSGDTPVGGACQADATCVPGAVCSGERCARVCDEIADCQGTGLCFPDPFSGGRTVCLSF